jgi:hypothetical protein
MPDGIIKAVMVGLNEGGAMKFPNHSPAHFSLSSGSDHTFHHVKRNTGCMIPVCPNTLHNEHGSYQEQA